MAVFVREGPRQLALDGFRPEPAQHAEAEAARFAAKVVADPRPGGCAHWIGAIGAIGNDGYGRFQAGTGPTARTVRPHLWVVEAAHGLRPVRVLVLHACDETGCVALEHLRLGTQAQNVAQMHARGRRGRRHTAAVDLRGPAGRARAIRVALAEGWDEDAFSAAVAAGDPRSRQLALPVHLPLAVGSRIPGGQEQSGKPLLATHLSARSGPYRTSAPPGTPVTPTRTWLLTRDIRSFPIPDSVIGAGLNARKETPAPSRITPVNGNLHRAGHTGTKTPSGWVVSLGGEPSAGPSTYGDDSAWRWDYLRGPLVVG